MSKINPTLLGSVWDNLIAITEEVGVVMRKTAHSPQVREGSDFSVGMCDYKGDLIAQGNFSPAQLGGMPFIVKHMLKDWIPVEKWEPGDCVLCNDPALGTGHLPDVYFVVPAFFDNKLVAFIIIVCHNIDVGGARPGSLSIVGVEELVQEGLHFYPINFYKRGEINQTLHDVMWWNVRDPEVLLGDMKAQRAAIEYHGLPRLVALFEKHGLEMMFTYFEEIIERTERATRDKISKLPDGKYPAVDYIDGYGPGTPPIKLNVTVEVKGDEMIIDFTGTDPQVPAGINIYLTYNRAYTMAGVKAVLAPQIPMNEGGWRPVKVTAPEGCFVNAKTGAPCGGRAIIGPVITTIVTTALAPLFPDRSLGGYSNLMHLSWGGRNPKTGDTIASVLSFYGGHGASSSADGTEDAGPYIASNMPVEVWESKVPTRIESFTIVPDSGGAGKYRGSISVRKDIRVLFHECRFNVGTVRTKFGPPGIFGGKPGGVSSVDIYRDGDKQEIGGMANSHFQYNDVLTVISAGGGGYGNPLERDIQLIEEDVARGYVSIEGALRDYGVTIDPNTGKGHRI